MTERMVVMTIEPSKRLSEIIGFPYFIEKRVPLKDLCLSGEEIKRMESGEQIFKALPANVIPEGG